MTSEPDWFECDFSFYTIALHAIHKLLSHVFQKLVQKTVVFKRGFKWVCTKCDPNNSYSWVFGKEHCQSGISIIKNMKIECENLSHKCLKDVYWKIEFF